MITYIMQLPAVRKPEYMIQHATHSIKTTGRLMDSHVNNVIHLVINKYIREIVQMVVIAKKQQPWHEVANWQIIK